MLRQRVLEMLNAVNLSEVDPFEIEPHSEEARYIVRRALRDIEPSDSGFPNQVYWLTEAVRVLWNALEEERRVPKGVREMIEEFSEVLKYETSPAKIREYELEIESCKNLALEAEKAQALLCSDLDRIKTLILTEVLDDSKAQMLGVGDRAIFVVDKQIRIFYDDGKVITL